MAIAASMFSAGTLDGTTTAVFYVSLCSFIVSFLNICMNFPRLLADKEKELKLREKEIMNLNSAQDDFSKQLEITTTSNVVALQAKIFGAMTAKYPGSPLPGGEYEQCIIHPDDSMGENSLKDLEELADSIPQTDEAAERSQPTKYRGLDTTSSSSWIYRPTVVQTIEYGLPIAMQDGLKINKTRDTFPTKVFADPKKTKPEDPKKMLNKPVETTEDAQMKVLQWLKEQAQEQEPNLDRTKLDQIQKELDKGLPKANTNAWVWTMNQNQIGSNPNDTAQLTSVTVGSKPPSVVGDQGWALQSGDELRMIERVVQQHKSDSSKAIIESTVLKLENEKDCATWLQDHYGEREPLMGGSDSAESGITEERLVLTFKKANWKKQIFHNYARKLANIYMLNQIERLDYGVSVETKQKTGKMTAKERHSHLEEMQKAR
jgi:hypothetical protein